MKMHHAFAMTLTMTCDRAFVKALLGLLTALILTTALNQRANAAGDPIYRWVDDEGITHYGEKPPEEKKKGVEKLKTRKDYSSDAQAARKALEEKRQAREASTKDSSMPTSEDAEQMIAERKKKIEEACKTAKNNLQVLSSHGRVKETGDDGEQRFLSEKEHADRIRKTTTYLNENCGDAP